MATTATTATTAATDAGCTARELTVVIEARSSGLPGAFVCVIAAHAADRPSDVGRALALGETVHYMNGSSELLRVALDAGIDAHALVQRACRHVSPHWLLSASACRVLVASLRS
ncbi:hypothetical protein LDC_2006 [sediment metagenome]|uniref:Uncharacterized protein n=1 Tax=sediment metagenome TaxID=749907 RepID=D9PKE1_9ZZZZ